MNTHYALLPGSRDPERLLREAVDAWDGGDAWIFGYASLIWRPEFDSVEHRPATVHGWHRALAMRSRVNRGTPECPGLVFALVQGGSCRGRVYRVERATRRGRAATGSGRARCRPASTTRSGCPAARRRASCAPSPSRSTGAARATPAGSTTSRWSRSCAPPTAATAARSPTWWRRRRSLRNCGIRDRDIERLVDARPAQRAHGLSGARRRAGARRRRRARRADCQVVLRCRCRSARRDRRARRRTPDSARPAGARLRRRRARSARE